jgi:RNA polymerase sigma-70 factor (ECF subfamily)
MAARASYDQDRGDGPPGFETLVQLYYEPLYRFAMSLTRAESDAADLVQETFLKWGAKGAQLQDPSKAKSWLFTTLHRAFLESRRRYARFPHLELEAAADELPMTEPAAIQHLAAGEAVELLARVDEQYRSAVALYYLEDYSYQEIADVLEVPLGTVKSRIARGLSQLKHLVGVRLARTTADKEGS